ncbi:class I SAM-dependent methyltransferase [Marinobacterium sp. YM272]|uniref:class I SAM-dependent methyltransferase n=1 Tax=Marinobacterium sp. YM272 TaxID=3421654 RepID=UPI003D7FFE33
MKPAEYSQMNPAALAPKAGWFNQRCLETILKHMPRLERGMLDLYLPDGQRLTFGQASPAEPHAELRLHSYRPLRRILRGGLIGWAEGYMEGEWDSPDLSALIRWAVHNESAMAEFLDGHRLMKLINRLFHLSRNNSRRGSRRNIAYHYDLGNDFYRLWLDPSMTYSAALFEEHESLQAAQLNKYRRICRMLKLQPGQQVLEIGCGWGGFAEVAAAEFGVRVHGITLSREQLEFARERAREAGLETLCSFSLTDYRDLSERYDHIVSIEMFEAVGEAHWAGYFDTLKRCLKPGGEAVLQVISIAEDRFESYRRGADFIQRYIFPGGMLPSPSVMKSCLRQQGLSLEEELLFGADYARTLACWHRAFDEHWPAVRDQGFDERFRRMWKYYLSYCEGGFLEGTIDVGLYRLKPR